MAKAKAVQEMSTTCNLGNATLETVRLDKKIKNTHSHAWIDSKISAADQSDRANLSRLQLLTKKNNHGVKWFKNATRDQN